MPTKTKRKTLAHVKKLSTLLAIGLRDLRKQERAKNSVVDMGTWLQWNGKCSACFAGSVMRFSLDCKRHGESTPYEYPNETYRPLSALNCLRLGMVFDASHRMCINTKVRDRGVGKYDGPNGEWWKSMRQLLKELKAANE